MQITTTEYARLIAAASQVTLLAAHAAEQVETIAWLRARVQHLEQMPVPVPASMSHPLTSRPDPVPPTRDTIMAKIESMFDDVGDDVAHQLGITNDAVTGELIYETRPA